MDGPLWGVDEAVDHVFVYCERIRGLLGCLREWCDGFRSSHFFISGPRCKVKVKREVCLGLAKMAIWRTRRNNILGVDFKAMVTGRITN